MSIRVALNHKTRYRYSRPVWLSPQVVRLRPAPHCRTPVPSYSLKITPAEHFINWQQDPYSNHLARLVIPEKTSEFFVEVDLVADLTVTNPFDFFLEKYAEKIPFVYDAVLARELTPYLELISPSPLTEALAREVRKQSMPTVDYLVELNQKIQQRVNYLIRLEQGVQTPDETLSIGSGSCRDSAWLLAQVFRRLGLASRFVSGYLIQLVADVKSLDGPSGAEKDFTDLHAWTEVYLPGAGWIGLDPTSGLFAGEGHIPLACSADPVTAAAISGTFAPDDQSIVTEESRDRAPSPDPVTVTLEFEMSVKRIHEDPRVTKPYTDSQWNEIVNLGHQVDADLLAQDVRLTMGGEPTFVSIDDRDAAEWNTAAMGPKKYERADMLIRRLRDRFASGGFLHHGQGKWYPGEPLPRWALGLYWRKDGEPIWRNSSLVADEAKPGKLTNEHALAFIEELAGRLEVDEAHAVPGYEDAWYYMWKERRLPTNVDPLDNKLDSPEVRAQLAHVFEQGLDHVVGYVLPLRKETETDGSSHWESSQWYFRPNRMFLGPGNSPMGLRLPLDALPWVKPEDVLHVTEEDPAAERPDLRSRAAMSGKTGSLATGPLRHSHRKRTEKSSRPGPVKPRIKKLPQKDAPSDEESASRHRTALCTEVRGGVLRVFMPPLQTLDDYLELVAALEDTAAALSIPILVEGYTPPNDARIHTVKVTPDPGVIEVNIHPAASWDELVQNTTTLYEEARLTRLASEKFMMDGRHTGTGGGNHIIVGGPTPSDSPVLRNPALLRSLLSYWHNHPALSYLFSGLFVGPTSQAPRFDEARDDQVYELELAFQEVPEDSICPPWLVDRIFRNLLIDSAGSTHRAEFCIDKLYAPESATGRLGLLELRAFEMPPHAQMSLTQHLLLRALVARFWKRPYREPLARWRTEIHDRFMLPHFVRQDMDDVFAEMDEAGYPVSMEWLAPHFEFRYPLYGAIEHRGITMELRQATEPWHVMADASSDGGTARYVDSSVERLQVLIRGMTDGRHIVACNGMRVPLHPTGTNGEFVAGVRYRAWQPAQCLHPTIPVHSPLVFDIVDSWSGRSIGGCTYHVTHPGGRSYDHFPVNAYEAESRRMARFFKIGHTPGTLSVGEARISKELPFTLDLRFQPSRLGSAKP